MSRSLVIPSLIDDAHEASSVHDMRLRVLRRIEAAVGYDTAVFLDARPEGGRPVAVNKERAPYFFGLYASAPRHYQQRLHPVLDATLGWQGACIDTETFSANERDRMPFYADIVRPQGIQSQLIGRVGFRGVSIGLIYLCRHGRGGFRDSAKQRFARLLPVLGTFEAAWKTSPPAALGAPHILTRREREIAAYVARGLRNRDIASVLGTSPNTVRNQLVRVFEKLGVAGRAELAAWATRAGLDD